MRNFWCLALGLAITIRAEAQPSLTVSITPLSPVAGQPATLRGTVVPPQPGVVTFMDGIAEIGKANADGHGVATLIANFRSRSPEHR